MRTLLLGSLASLALAIPTSKDGALRKKHEHVKAKWKHLPLVGHAGTVGKLDADCTEDGKCPDELIGSGLCCSVDSVSQICGHPYPGRPEVYAPRMGSPCPGRPRTFCCDTSDPTEHC